MTSAAIVMHGLLNNGNFPLCGSDSAAATIAWAHTTCPACQVIIAKGVIAALAKQGGRIWLDDIGDALVAALTDAARPEPVSCGAKCFKPSCEMPCYLPRNHVGYHTCVGSR